MQIKAIRNKKEMKIKIPELKPSCPLVRFSVYDEEPTYFIYLGLLFQPLTLNYLENWESIDEAPKDLSNIYVNAQSTPDRTEVVVLTQVLQGAVNAGYDFADIPVVSVNGRKFTNIKEMVYLIEHTETETLEISSAYGDKFVLPSPKAEITRKEHEKILMIYKVPKDRSSNLDDVTDRFVLK